jgi:hypothetical protein
MSAPERPALPPDDEPPPQRQPAAPTGPLLNYTLATVCPACNAPTFRLACKVRCGRCGFVWDCSEL